MITCTRSCEESVLLHEKPACSVRQQQTAKSESNDSKQQWRPADVVAIVVVVVVVWLWVCRRRLSFVVASLLLPFDAGGKTARPQKWSWLCLLDTSTSQVMAATLRRCDVQVHLVVLCCAGGTTSYELWRLQSWDLQPRRCSVPGTWFKGGEINGITESELRNRRKRSNKPQNCAIEGYEILTRYQLPVPGTRFYRQYQVPDRLWPVLYIRRGLFFRWHSELVQFTRQRHHVNNVNNVNNVNISQSMWQQNIVEGKRRICDEVRIHLLLSLYLYFSVTIDLHLTYQRLYLVKSLLLTASTFTWTVWPCWMKPLMYPYHVPGTRYQVPGTR